MNNWWKLMAWLMVLGLTAVGVYRPVLAKEKVDTDAECTISVKIDKNGAASGGSFSAYRVAKVVNSDGVDEFKSLYGDVTVDISTAETTTKLAKEYYENYISEDSDLEADSTTEAAEGVITFSKLKPGLYLIVQDEAVSDYSDLSYFLISVPYWDETNGKYVYEVTSSSKGTITSDSSESTTETDDTDDTDDTDEDVEDDDGDDSSNSDSDDSSSKNLPQTGQLWWPLPILLCAGVVLMLVGRKIKK